MGGQIISAVSSALGAGPFSVGASVSLPPQPAIRPPDKALTVVAALKRNRRRLRRQLDISSPVRSKDKCWLLESTLIISAAFQETESFHGRIHSTLACNPQAFRRRIGPNRQGPASG